MTRLMLVTMKPMIAKVEWHPGELVPRDMRWIAPSDKDAATATLERHLWDAADQFRANSGRKSQEYSAPDGNQPPTGQTVGPGHYGPIRSHVRGREW